MPVQNNLEKAIPKLYKRSALNHLLYGYIKGLKNTLVSISTLDAVRMFMEDFGLMKDEDVKEESLLTAYNRMNAELLEILKQNNKDGDHN